METNIIGQTDFWEKCALPRMSDEFIRHLIHDELDTQELYLVERHRLYDWLFPEYYTKEEKEILDLFSQMVSERKTAIYGTGIAARILLNCGFYNQIAGGIKKGRELFFIKR